MDEEDSMDGTEIKESTGPQDTGEILQSLFYPLCTCYVRSDMEDFLVDSVIQRSASKGYCSKGRGVSPLLRQEG